MSPARASHSGIGGAGGWTFFATVEVVKPTDTSSAPRRSRGATDGLGALAVASGRARTSLSGTTGCRAAGLASNRGCGCNFEDTFMRSGESDSCVVGTSVVGTAELTTDPAEPRSCARSSTVLASTTSVSITVAGAKSCLVTNGNAGTDDARGGSGPL